MSNHRLVHPALYAESTDGRVTLLARKCARCGHVAFPRQPFGCVKCGAVPSPDEDVHMEPIGELLSFATVYQHHGGDIHAPFVLGEIRLGGGPTIRAAMTEGTAGESLKTGMRVRGVLQPVGKSATGEAVLELRFQADGGE